MIKNKTIYEYLSSNLKNKYKLKKFTNNLHKYFIFY